MVDIWFSGRKVEMIFFDDMISFFVIYIYIYVYISLRVYRYIYIVVYRYTGKSIICLLISTLKKKTFGHFFQDFPGSSGSDPTSSPGHWSNHDPSASTILKQMSIIAHVLNFMVFFVNLPNTKEKEYEGFLFNQGHGVILMYHFSGFQHQQGSNIMFTPPKLQIFAPEKWWLEDVFPFWEGLFFGAMWNFQGGNDSTHDSNQFQAAARISVSGTSLPPHFAHHFGIGFSVGGAGGKNRHQKIQGSLQSHPKPCSIIREISQNYHTFVLFDPQKPMGAIWPLKYCWCFRNPIPNQLGWCCFTRRKQWDKLPTSTG